MTNDPQTITLGDKIYKVADLSDNAKLIVSTLAENEGLQAHHAASTKHLQLSHQALLSNLEMALADVAYEQVESETMPVDLPSI